MNAEDKKKIAEIMEKHGVLVGYLFGSAARGTMGPYSDIDVAVFFDAQKVPEEKQFDEKLAVSSEIASAFNVENADIIILNNLTNPVLLHESVLNGEPILVKNSEFKSRIARFALHQYEDTRYLREISYRILHEQIKSGQFGRASATNKRYVSVK